MTGRDDGVGMNKAGRDISRKKEERERRQCCRDK